MSPVIENENIAVFQKVWVMLLSENSWAEFPFEIARFLVENADRGSVPKAHQYTIFRKWHNRVAVGPFGAVVVEG